jgi:hypothetical protein
MRLRRMCAFGVAWVVAIVPAPAALAFGGPNPNPKAVEKCFANIDKQTAKEISAGGGPKAGVPAQTNCDHFFQDTGAIGNGLPGPG